MYDLTDLDAYKHAKIIRKELSELAREFPQEEKYLLTQQLIRACRSVTANIAEGFGRFHFKENIQFCRQARGSLYECYDHISCASDETYIDLKQKDHYDSKIRNSIKLLNGYINYLKKQLEASN